MGGGMWNADATGGGGEVGGRGVGVGLDAGAGGGACAGDGESVGYVGRLAPSPTGWLHLGHARTFWEATRRAKAAGGRLLLRNDDLDTGRCRAEFVVGMEEDLRWLGIGWEGARVTQTERLARYREGLRRLRERGLIYPCYRSRKEVAEAVSAPHEGGAEDEPIFPVALRPPEGVDGRELSLDEGGREEVGGGGGDGWRVNWRFRVKEGEKVGFCDGRLGWQEAEAGRDFGDFLVWRKDGVPSYQLACAVDDAELGITEVVRGEDLVKSTFRQVLLLEAWGVRRPEYFHCALVRDGEGVRLAKRHDALSLRAMRERGVGVAEILAQFVGETEG